MKILSQDLMSAFECSKSDSRYYAKFEVYGYYLDDNGVEQTDGVVVTITADGYTQVDNYIRVPLGTEVTYQVSREHYVSSPSSTCVVTGDTYKRVRMSNEELWQFNVNTTPEDASVTIIGNGQTTTNKSIEVPKLTTVTYSVSRNQMNPISNKQRLIPMNEEESSPITVSEVLTSTISVNGVKDSRTGQILENAQVRWIVSQGDPIYGTDPITTLCTNEVDLLVTLNGYDSYSAHFPESGSYLVNRDLGYITLTPTVYYCTVACNMSGATIVMWKEVNGVEVSGSRTEPMQSPAQYPCYVGDEVHWSVSAPNYKTITGSAEIPVGGHSEVIDLPVQDYAVSITSNPSEALVEILEGQVIKASGRGLAQTSINYGTTIIYRATLGGVTVTKVAPITSNFSGQIVLNAQSGASVTLIDTPGTSSVTLPYGLYKFVLFGAGGGGHESPAAATSTAYGGTGSSGGGGGGSGYVLVRNIQINNVDGANVTCVVGTGGAHNNNGGATSVTLGNTTYTANGGKTGFLNSITAPYYYDYGGDGGCGGGRGGVFGQEIPRDGVIIENTNGSGGGVQGSNGGSITYTNLQTHATNTISGGVGEYGDLGLYYDNYGARSTTLTNGSPGGAGIGCESNVKTTILSLPSLYASNETNAQYFYQYMTGGGGGGSSGTPQHSTTPPTIYGGPGGGGAGWASGTAGTAGSSGTPGTAGSGGDGAILYMRIAWS